jgi:hypothetical protein
VFSVPYVNVAHSVIIFLKNEILFVVCFLNSESDTKILTVLNAQLPVRMTGLRWKIIVVSVIFMAQFLPMKCLNITTTEGKLSVHKIFMTGVVKQRCMTETL